MPFVLITLQMLVVWILMSGIHSSLVAEAAPYTFPDPGLQSAVAEAIGKASTELTLEDLSSPFFTLLPAENRKIRNLEEIEHCTSLIELILSNNEIEDLRPLSKMTWLRSLSIDNNQIKDLAPLSTLAQLNDLWVSRNQISDLKPVSLMKCLKVLEAGDNRIVDLGPLQELHELVHLWMANNRIQSIFPLSGLLELRSVRLAQNQIRDASQLIGLPHLEKIDLEMNPVCMDRFREKGISTIIDIWGRPLDPSQFSPSVPGLCDAWKYSPDKDAGFVFNVSSEVSVDVIWAGNCYGLGIDECKIRMTRPVSEYPFSPEEIDRRFVTPLFESAGVPDWPRSWKYFILGGENYFSKRLAQRINFSLQERAVTGISVKFEYLYTGQIAPDWE